MSRQRIKIIYFSALEIYVGTVGSLKRLQIDSLLQRALRTDVGVFWLGSVKSERMQPHLEIENN